MAVKIQLRRDTAANWTSKNPILALGEPGVETDTNKLKFGNGTTLWNDLEYFAGGESIENIEDILGTSFLVAGSGIILNYSDSGNTLTISSSGVGGPVVLPIENADLHNGGIQQAQVLRFDNGSYQSVITGTVPPSGNNAQRIIIQGPRAQGNGEGGDVYFWGGDADINGGDIKIYAGDADNVSPDNGYGGYVNIDGGRGATVGGNVEITAGYSQGGQAGRVEIVGGSTSSGTAGDVVVKTNNSIQNWTFGTNGSLTLPNGNLIQSQANQGETNIQIIDNESPFKIYTNASTGAKEWRYDSDGNLFIPGNITLPNYTTVATGTFDNGTGGNHGISLNCVVGYELNWQGGHLKSTLNNGETTYNILCDSAIEFPGSGVDNVQIDHSGITFSDGTVQYSAIRNIFGGSGISVSSASGDYTISASGVVAGSAESIQTTCFNNTGATLSKGTVVYINGRNGNLPTVQKSIATNEAGSSKTYGILFEDITDNHSGNVIVIGALTNFNTNQFSAAEGSTLYLSPSVSGAMTATKPSAPDHLVSVGKIVRNHNNQGIIQVIIQNGFELQELHNVAINGVTGGQFLQYNSVSQLWTPSSSGNFTTLQVNGTGVSVTGHTHSSSNITDFTESVQDVVGGNGFLVGSSGIVINYNDAGNTLTISTSGLASSNHTHSSANITDFTEAVQDVVGASGFLVGASGISISYNDGSNTLTITGGGGGGTTIANASNNRILTSDGTSTGINAESNMTFDGTNLVVTGNGKFTQLQPTVVSNGNVNGSVATDVGAGQIFDMTLTGAITLSNPTNPIDGVTIRWRILQDGTGSHTVSLDTKFVIPSSASNPLPWSTAANAMDILAATYHAGRDKWDIVAFVPGY